MHTFVSLYLNVWNVNYAMNGDAARRASLWAEVVVVGHSADVVALVVATAHRVAGRVLSRRHDRRRRAGGWRSSHRERRRAGRGLLGGVHVRFLLRLADVFLVADPLVSEPIANLGHLQWTKRENIFFIICLHAKMTHSIKWNATTDEGDHLLSKSNLYFVNSISTQRIFTK